MTTTRWYVYGMVGIVSIIKTIVMIVKEVKGKKWGVTKNLEWYRGAYPNHVGDSWVKCCNCSGTNVHIRDTGKTFKAILNSHVCAICGQELYRSRTLR